MSVGPLRELATALAADADLPALVVDAIADAGRPVGRADDGDRRRRDRHVLVDDPGLHGGPHRPLVALGHVHAIDDDLVLLGEDAHDRALLAAVLAGEDADPVTFHQLHQRTSGASETMR